MEAVEKGRKLVAVVAATYVVTSLATIAVYVTVRGTEKLTVQLVRFILTVGLAYALLLAKPWARWIGIVTSFLASCVGLFGVLAATGARGIGSMAGVMITYLGCGCVLAFAPSVSAFFASAGQR